MRSILLIMTNTLRVTFRRKSSFIIYLLLPVAGVLLALSIMSGGSSRPVRIGVVDHDGGPYASDLTSNFESWGNYRVEAVRASELGSLIAAGKIDCGIEIPAGYSASIPTGRIERVSLVSLKGQAVTAVLESLINQYSGALSDLAKGSGGSVERFRALYDRTRTQGATLVVDHLPDQLRNKAVTYTSLGYFVMFVMLGAGITSQLILAEKRSRTYYRICGAPVRSRDYLAGNGLAGLSIIFVQIITVMVVLRGILKVDTYAPDLLLAAILAVFGLVAVALGMLIAAFARSSGAAAALSTLIITPSCMLAGCFWSLSFMPPFMQKIALFMPQRWVLDAVTKLQAGGSAAGVAANTIVLAAFAVTFFVVAAYGFARREESGQFV